MTEVVKLLANTIVLGAANNNINNAKLVRVLNSGTTPGLITQFDTVASVQLGTVVVGANTVIAIEKANTDVLTSNHASAIFAVKIAYR